MKKIFLLQSGLWAEPAEDIRIIAFEDEYDAWMYVFRYYGYKHLERKNWQKKKGFRGILRLRNRWVLLKEIKYKTKSKESR